MDPVGTPPPAPAPGRVLVVEGGGMRGAYSAGVVAGLVQAGHRFDALYAASSGACSAAYLVAGQLHGIDIWRNHLHGPRLIGIHKLLRKRCYLDLDYLVDHLFTNHLPLDVATLRASPAPLWVVITRADNGEPEYHDIRKSPNPLRLLKASAALPIAYGRPVEYEGTLYLDGGIADPLPVRKAIEDGARDIVVVRTRPETYRKASSFEWIGRLASRPYPGAHPAFRQLAARYNDALELLRHPPEGVTIHSIAPPPTLRLSRLMRGAKDLRQATMQGLEDAARAAARLGPPPGQRLAP